MGVALCQPRADGGKNIITYSSAKFKPAETRYHSNEQECLAVLRAVKKCRHFVEDRPLTLKTDKGLTWLHRFKETRDKLKRWSLLLQEFDMTIEHCPGKENKLADLLSRNPVEEVTEELDDQERLLTPTNDEAVRSPEKEPNTAVYVIESRTFVEEIRDDQQTDPYRSRMARRHMYLIRQSNLTKEEQHFVECYGVIDDILWKRDDPDGPYKILVPQAAVARVLHDYHDSEYARHPGAEETLRAILEFHRWPKMREEIRDYVRHCFLRTCCKNSNTATATTQRPNQPKKPWDTISVDLMDSYPRSSKGRRYILVATDMFSRWVEAFPICSSDANRVIRIMKEEVFSRSGYPHAILSDNGPQFISKAWKEACERWKTQH